MATTASAKRINCASSITMLRPDALNTTVMPIDTSRQSAMNKGPSRCNASSSRAEPVRVR